jgi:TetR/AcrR family transcriptional regulator
VAQAKPARRPRRDRADIRQLILESALVEFGAMGFAGASTRSIAERIDAHQPQISYHFESKWSLWCAAVDHLFALLIEAMDGVDLGPLDGTGDPDVLAHGFADSVRRQVRFAAAHPELNQILVHEATANTDRLTWMTERHVKPIYEAVRTAWRLLREAGLAAPIHESFIHYVIVGAASLPYVMLAESRTLTGIDPIDPAWVEIHANGLVSTLLPAPRQS